MDTQKEDEFLNLWATKTGKSKEALKEILKQVEADAKAAGCEGNMQVIKGNFGRRVRGMLWGEQTGRKSLRSEPVTFRGFLLGADNIRDTLDWQRRDAMRKFRDNPEEARLSGYVDEQNNPLDVRLTIKDRRGKEVDNPNYHKPLLGHNWVRDVYGVAVKGAEETPKLFRFSLWGAMATKFAYRPFTPREFQARIKSEGDYLELSPVLKKGEETIKPTNMNIDYQDWIRKACAGRTYALDQMEKAVANTENARDKWILVEATVDNIDAEINQRTGRRNLRIVDLDSGSTDVFWTSMPKDFPIAFREYSKVLVFCTVRKWKREEDEEFQYSLNGISMYPIPGETVETKVDLARAANGETGEEEGWNIFGE